jgi:hypothetical protein
MKTIWKLVIFLFCVCAGASAQVAPAATGRTEPILVSKLQYALRYSQSAQFSSAYSSSIQNSTVSGDVFYVGHNSRYPFTMNYGGGYSWVLSGPNYTSGQSHRMFLSQGIDWRRTKILLGDNVSYLPQSPTTGFLGIAGTGEPIGNQNPSPSNSQTILTTNTHIVANETRVQIVRELSPLTEVSASGVYGIIRYPDGDGVDTTTKNVMALWSHRLDSRNTVMGIYQYSQFSYSISPVTIDTQIAQLGFSRRWTRDFSTSLSAGPQWTNSSYSTVVPQSSDVAISATANYRKQLTQLNASYTRSTNGGSGYYVGGEIDVISGGFTRDFRRNLTLGCSGGYQRTTGLSTQNDGTTKGVFGSSQATWQVNRELITFVNYTATNQTSSGVLPSNAINYLTHNISFGIGFSPRKANLR